MVLSIIALWIAKILFGSRAGLRVPVVGAVLMAVLVKANHAFDNNEIAKKRFCVFCRGTVDTVTFLRALDRRLFVSSVRVTGVDRDVKAFCSV